MNVRQIINRKGSEVSTARPETTVGEVVVALAGQGVGALVVSADAVAVEGIVSERDIVRAIASDGAEVLSWPVSRVMTTSVETCSLEQTADQLMAVMTQGRFRHVPVVDDGALAGIISIGDVVKERVNELETEARDMLAYIQGQ